MRMEYTAQLEQMHEDLVHMGGLCEQAITLAARCLKHCDPDLQQDGPIRAVMACSGTSMHTLCSA